MGSLSACLVKYIDIFEVVIALLQILNHNQILPLNARRQTEFGLGDGNVSQRICFQALAQTCRRPRGCIPKLSITSVDTGNCFGFGIDMKILRHVLNLRNNTRLLFLNIVMVCCQIQSFDPKTPILSPLHCCFAQQYSAWCLSWLKQTMFTTLIFCTHGNYNLMSRR